MLIVDPPDGGLGSPNCGWGGAGLYDLSPDTPDNTKSSTIIFSKIAIVYRYNFRLTWFFTPCLLITFSDPKRDCRQTF